MLTNTSELSWTVLLDILLVAVILYSVYLLIKETRALRILYGLVALAALYLAGQLLNLAALKILLQSVFTVMLVAIPVVFQPELRAALERIGRGEFVSGLLASKRGRSRSIVSELVGTVRQLRRTKEGALIVLERTTGLGDLARSGVMLDARVSQELLLTIFFSKSPLHDGAVLIRGDRLVAASVFLPLAEDTLHYSLGTRHRAALGLSKETDAIVIVVSEETGRISLAHRKSLDVVAPAELERRLRLLLGVRGAIHA